MHTNKEDLSARQKELVDEITRCLQQMHAVTVDSEVGVDFDGQAELKDAYEAALQLLKEGQWKSASDAVEQLTLRESYAWDDPKAASDIEDLEDVLYDLHVAYNDAFGFESDS